MDLDVDPFLLSLVYEVIENIGQHEVYPFGLLYLVFSAIVGF